MCFGELAIKALATSNNNGEVHFRELDETLSIKFVIGYKLLLIKCKKNNVHDNSGESTCAICERNSCKLRTLIIYKATEPLKEKFRFLDSPQVEQEVKCIRGIFDLFINKNMFGLGFYVDYKLSRAEFDTTIFYPGCYSDCSPKGFMELNKFRQTIFQTKDVFIDKLEIESPL